MTDTMGTTSRTDSPADINVAISDDMAIRCAYWHDDYSNIMAIRREVFIIEQNVSEAEEIDGLDELPSTLHFLAFINDKAVATARVLESGKIGRISVLKQYRRKGIGEALLRRVLRFCIDNTPMSMLYMHAQISALPLYEKCGFIAKGEVFDEANIQHRRMELQLRSSDALEQVYQDEVIRLETAPEFIKHIEQITSAAQNSIHILSQELSRHVYDSTFISALSRFARSQRNAKVRILLHSTKSLTSNNSAIVNLAQRLPSSIEIKQLRDGARSINGNNEEEGFIIADLRHIVFFNDEKNLHGFTNYRAKAEARHQLDAFDYLWQHLSDKDPNLSRLSL